MKINARLHQIGAWSFVGFFITAASYAVFVRQPMFAPGFLLASVPGWFALLYFGPIEIDEDSIRQRTLLGRFEIKWDEVRQIELCHLPPPPAEVAPHAQRADQMARLFFALCPPDVNLMSYTLVFRGESQILTISGPFFWPDAAQNGGAIVICEQVRRRNIVPVPGKRWFHFPRGTRVRT